MLPDVDQERTGAGAVSSPVVVVWRAMSTSPRIIIERVVQGRAPFSRDIVEAILEVAYLAMCVDGRLTDEEIEAFSHVAGALLASQSPPGYRVQADTHRVAPPLELRETNRWLDRFAERVSRDGVDERLMAVAPLLTDPTARAVAYQIACLIAVSDFDTSDRDDDLHLQLIEALGFTQEDADGLADEAHRAAGGG
jgi:tellurite resistance protein